MITLKTSTPTKSRRKIARCDQCEGALPKGFDTVTPKPNQFEPNYGQLRSFYLKRNGLPLKLREWYEFPFPAPLNHYDYQRYHAKKHFAFQDAAEHYVHGWDHTPFQTEVVSNEYPLLYDTYCHGNIRFHGDDDMWKSKVFINPTYGDVILAANKYGFDTGIRYLRFALYNDMEPDFVSGEPDDEGALGVYLYT
jgi:hypothetical protein